MGDLLHCIQCGYRLPIPVEPTDEAQAASEGSCPECGLAVSRTIDAWAACGGHAPVMERVGRQASILAVPIGFLALGWSFEWLLTFVGPTITLDRGTVVPLGSTLNTPFVITSCVIAFLWWRMTARPDPWTGHASRRSARARASVWCTLCVIALIMESAPLWVMFQSMGWFNWWPGPVSITVATVPLLPFAAGWAALRLMPPAPMMDARRSQRWMRRAALATLLLSTLVGVGYVGGNILFYNLNTPGAGAPLFELIFNSTIILSAIALPLVLLGLTGTLLALGASARRRAPRRDAALIVLGAISIVLILFATLISDIASAARPFPSRVLLSELLAALRDFLHAQEWWPQIIVTLLFVGVVTLWVIASAAPGFVARRASKAAAEA